MNQSEDKYCKLKIINIVNYRQLIRNEVLITPSVRLRFTSVYHRFKEEIPSGDQIPNV